MSEIECDRLIADAERVRREDGFLIATVWEEYPSKAPLPGESWMQMMERTEEARDAAKDQAKARAIRFAASGDMLLALQEVLATPGLQSGLQAMCAAAIARATGRDVADVVRDTTPPYSAPFTMDVPQCCGDPATCNDPCEPREQKETILRYQRDEARARLERCIKILTRVHSFMTPEDVRLPDGRVMRFSNAEIEREMLRGLCAAIRAIPDELSAIERPEGGDVANVIKGD